MDKSPLIQITQLIKSYPMGEICTRVLKSVSLTIYPGELIAIVGASGSGKSTLMNILGLLDIGDSGKYILNQRDVMSLSADELANVRNREIGFVFQQFYLLPRFTAAQNVALPLTYRDDNEPINARVQAALNCVGMATFANHLPTQLSGGQQQRVAIARALVGEPNVILADEPTGSLDSKTAKDIFALFLELHRRGRTVIIVTHDEKIAASCTRRITLDDGNIVKERV